MIQAAGLLQEMQELRRRLRYLQEFRAILLRGQAICLIRFSRSQEHLCRLHPECLSLKAKTTRGGAICL